MGREEAAQELSILPLRRGKSNTILFSKMESVNLKRRCFCEHGGRT